MAVVSDKHRSQSAADKLLAPGHSKKDGNTIVV